MLIRMLISPTWVPLWSFLVSWLMSYIKPDFTMSRTSLITIVLTFREDIAGKLIPIHDFLLLRHAPYHSLTADALLASIFCIGPKALLRIKCNRRIRARLQAMFSLDTKKTSRCYKLPLLSPFFKPPHDVSFISSKLCSTWVNAKLIHQHI